MFKHLYMKTLSLGPKEHNYGFFSCCSVILTRIVEFIQLHKSLPDFLDTSIMFRWYKDQIHANTDLTFQYFMHYSQTNSIIPNTNIQYHWEYQFEDYTKIDYNLICPIVQKYFTPSIEIQNIIRSMENKYKLDYNKLCVLFYRGNDKNRETKICGYDEYVHYSNLVLAKHPDTIFLIQSDETEFIQYFSNLFPTNHIVFQDEIRHVKKCNSTVDILFRQSNLLFSKYYLAITIIMAKCNYIVCGSGNCSIWILFYRGNSKNLFQNLNGSWIEG